jgi:hypothetical protein
VPWVLKYDRKHLHVTALVDDPGDFCREVNGCTFQEASGQTDCAGVEPISDLRLFGRDGRRPWISQCPTGLSDGWIDEHKKSQQNDSGSCKKNHCDLPLKEGATASGKSFQSPRCKGELSNSFLADPDTLDYRPYETW